MLFRRFPSRRAMLLAMGVVVGLTTMSVNAQSYVVSPSEYATTEAPSLANLEGFPSYRLQQVYGASDFAQLGPGPHVITRIDWRTDTSVTGPITYPSERFTMKLSTTKVEPNHLDPVFANNVGVREVAVVDGRVTLTSTSEVLPNGTHVFDYGFDFEQPYVYDPADGNLLADLTVINAEGPLLLDLAWIETTTATTSAYWTGTLGPDSPVAATTTDTIGGQYGGNIIRFTIVPEPTTAGAFALGLDSCKTEIELGESGGFGLNRDNFPKRRRLGHIFSIVHGGIRHARHRGISSPGPSRFGRLAAASNRGRFCRNGDRR
ncbi:MAG: hypothetical protein R3C28_07145 [Pirellulaceae bacterium]